MDKSTLNNLNAEAETQARIKTDMQMIKGLAGEYYALYYYNIEQKIFNIYALDQKRFPQAAGMVAAGGEPVEILKKFGTSALIHPDDRAEFADMDIAYVRERLAHGKRHSIRFRRIFDGEYRWAEMDFIKFEDYDEPANSIAIGFAERDFAIRSEQALNSAYEMLGIDCGPDDAINALLGIAGEFYDAGRCYIFELSGDKKLLDNTYEWCADGIEPMIDKLQGVPAEVCDGWFDEFGRRGAFFMDTRDSEHNTEQTKEILEMQGIESLVSAPIMKGDELVGFIGVDDPRKSLHDVAVLQGIANVAYSKILTRNELHRQEDRIRDIVDQQRHIKTFGDMINAALWSMNIGADDEIKEVYWSDEFRRMFGYDGSTEAFPNTVEAWSDLLHPDDKKRVTDELYQGIKSRDTAGYVYDVQYRIRRFTGEYCWYHAIGRMEDIRDGERRLYGIIADITSERALEENRILLNYFVRSFASAYSVNLIDDTFEVLNMNHDFSRVFTMDGNRADMEKLVSEHIHPDDREMMFRMIDKEYVSGRLKTEPSFTFVVREIYGGNERTMRGFIIRCLDEYHIAVGFMDITNEINKEREQQAKLAEALSMAESANRAKTTFLNNMSHDIRTPMNAIIGFTGLAENHIDNREQVRDYLGKITQSSKHLLSLINDVLDMSRIESGKMNLDEKPESLPEVIHTLSNIVQADMHAKQHAFFVDTVNIHDEYVVCDKLRLNQVLLNILSNSIKYTPAGGTISMRIAETMQKNNGYATYEFRIRDNGIGMDEEFVKRIFDPFTRVKSSTVSGIQGTGLGMTITKSITDMMGGSIEITSEPGKGTETVVTFVFKTQESGVADFRIPELNGMRALVTDDDANSCVSIESMLNEIGMRSEWCTSGREAVFRAENAVKRGDGFGVYIIDWMMPDMNGVETTRRIRRIVGNDVPIIVLSAYDWSDIKDEAVAAGVTAFIPKPVFQSDLNKTLYGCLGNSVTETVKSDKFDFSGKKILLVEDNELNREIAEEILGAVGIIVDTAEDGTVAVEKIKNAHAGDYNLILMDIQMPVMDGYEATRRIRAMGTDISKIPILAMTANAFEEDRKSALDAGMNEHISKPIDVDKLNMTLAEFLK